VAGFFDGEGTVGIYQVKNTREVRLQFANTHLATLEAIKSFMGCGFIMVNNRTVKATPRKICYTLSVRRKADIVKVGEAMLPHLLIKADLMRIALEEARVIRWPYNCRGKLEKLGVDEIRRMSVSLSPSKIGLALAIAPSTVVAFMDRHKIPRLDGRTGRLSLLGTNPDGQLPV